MESADGKWSGWKVVRMESGADGKRFGCEVVRMESGADGKGRRMGNVVFLSDGKCLDGK